MVVLNKIYTRTGDKGTTGLATGERVNKWELRVEAYGAADETNSSLGVARLQCLVGVTRQAHLCGRGIGESRTAIRGKRGKKRSTDKRKRYATNFHAAIMDC